MPNSGMYYINLNSSSMANIFINDNLRLSRLGLQVKDSESQWTELHCQQGRLDGACVVYSVVMSLLSIGYIRNKDIDVSKNPNPDKRTGKGRLLSRLLDENGLVRDGYYLRTMTKLIRESCPDLNIGYHTKGDYFLSIIKDSVENDVPVVISVNNNDMNHGITVIGIEYDNNEKVTKILCLDPGFSITDTAYWNCVIDVSKKGTSEYPYWYITSEIKSKVDILEIITISKSNKE